MKSGRLIGTITVAGLPLLATCQNPATEAPTSSENHAMLRGHAGAAILLSHSVEEVEDEVDATEAVG